MSDLLLSLQQDLVDKLNSENWFTYISVVSWRKQVIQLEVEKRLPHLTGKNGRKGCGVVVGMPRINATQPNLNPAQGDILVAVEVVEQPEINFNPGGTMLTAEETARAIRQTLHQFAIEGKILLYQDKRAIEPIKDIEYPGCLGYRVNLRGRMAELSQPKCVVPSISETAGFVTLSISDPDAAIYYTVDGSFPGASNAAALAYTAPFSVPSGAVVRWASYLAGYLGSDAAQAIVT